MDAYRASAEKERPSFGEDGAPAYTTCVTDDPALLEDEAADLAAIEGMSVFEMIGELLAAVAGIFERRLGGPGAIRRLRSVLAAFATVMLAMTVRQRATIFHHFPVSASRVLRHLCCPPSRWAGA